MELSGEEIKERLAELETKKSNTANIMKVAEIQDEIDQLTGEAQRRAINLKAEEDSDYECIGCSG